MIVITAPTGQIGGRLLDILLNEAPARGEELRVVVRDPTKLPDTVRARGRVDVVTGSHGDAAVVDRAFAGADAVFWLVPPAQQAPPSLDAVYSGFTRAAAKAFTAHGVGHVVGVSALGRGTPVADRAGHVTASLAMDDLIAGTGVAYRALANPTFMDNLLWQAASIRDHGVFTGTVTADRKAPVAATLTSPRPPPACCSTARGRGRARSRSWAPKTSRRTTWRASCPRCSAARSATTGSRSTPSVPHSPDAASGTHSWRATWT